MEDQALPSGTVTFLLTDIEDSTRLWDEGADSMDAALVRHDAIVARYVAARGGVVHGPRGEGDSHFTIFRSATAAVSAAVAIQLDLARERWPTRSAIRVRIAIHTGEAELTRGDYYGPEVNRCARVRALAGGGQTLLSEAAAVLAAAELPAGASLRDLGLYSLRGLTRPERVFQLVHADLPEHSPTIGRRTVRSNLPRQLTSFVGRERELRELCEAITRSQLVTLTGHGGTGKTRLALAAAESSLESFRDGVWFVDLSPLRESEHVPRALSEVLHIPEEAELPLAATLAARLSDRQMLIVFDNCEHVLEASATLADDLLKSCAELTILATSREPLAVAGEAVLTVPPMEIGDDVAQRAEGEDAVRLLAERAAHSVPGFAVTDANVEGVRTLCNAVDCLPLGIELVATLVRVLPIETLVERLERRLQLPTTAGRGRGARHRSLHAAVEWSYELLDDAEQSVFRRLAVFLGGFSLEAAEEVIPGAGVEGRDVLDVLSHLVEKSLLTVGTGAAGLVRYRQLETVRDFAKDRLDESGETDELQRRHLRHYQRFTERGFVERAADQPLWLLRMREDKDNVRAALSYARHADPDIGLAMVGALGGFWTDRGDHSEGRAWLEDFLALSIDNTMIRGRALIGLCNIASWMADHDTVMAAAPEALAIVRAHGNTRRIASCLNQISWNVDMVGEHELARPLTEELIDLIDEVQDPFLAAYMTGTAASFFRDEDVSKSRSLAEDACKRMRASGTHAPTHIAETTEIIARAAILQGDRPAAAQYIAESFALRREVGDELGVANVLWFAALHAVESGDPERGIRLAGAASALSEPFGFTAPPPHFDVRDRLEPARIKLGAKATRSWSEGRVMTSDEAVDYALGRRDVASVAAPSPILTPRELEVAQLLAEGLTNREVAERLVLSVRTVDAHVEHIRNKLGVRTRAQIATWVAEQRSERE